MPKCMECHENSAEREICSLKDMFTERRTVSKNNIAFYLKNLTLKFPDPFFCHLWSVVEPLHDFHFICCSFHPEIVFASLLNFYLITDLLFCDVIRILSFNYLVTVFYSSLNIFIIADFKFLSSVSTGRAFRCMASTGCSFPFMKALLSRFFACLTIVENLTFSRI